MHLTKSDFIHLYLKCPLHLWVAKHCPDEWGFKVDEALLWKFEEGNRVETIARQLFPQGQLVDGPEDDEVNRTKELIELGATTLFQATAHAGRLLAKADVFQFDPETERWNICEIKGSTSRKDVHIADLCFQRRAFLNEGFPIGKLLLGLVNNTFVRNGKVDSQAFIRIEDITADADAEQPEVDKRIEIALRILDHNDRPTRGSFGCTCAPRSCDCSHLCFPELPAQNIFSLPRFDNHRAQELFDKGTRAVGDLPSNQDLTETQRIVADAIRSGMPLIDHERIRERLSTLRYPLYFLDYESFSSAIPLVDGYHPFQQMVFQYSLHVLRDLNSETEHFEFLAGELSNPAPALLAKLRDDIGEEGSIVVWNKTFEVSRNNEMAHAHNEHSEFLKSLNGRVFDLMEIFRDQLFVHPNIGGSCSIKDVLPVLVPSLSYAALKVGDGTAASLTWKRMIANGCAPEEKASLRNDLLAYCRLDTLAMVEIFCVVSNLPSSQ